MSTRLLLLLFLSSAALNAGAEQILSSEYFPLVDGNYWAYSVSDFYDNNYDTTITVLPGFTDVNGIPTKALFNSYHDVTEYFTNDSEGIRLHRSVDPDPAEPSFTFNPPLIIAEPSPEIPGYSSILYSTAHTIIPDIQDEPFILSCQYSYYVVERDTVTVPADTYDTVRLSFTFRIFGTLPTGFTFDETANQTLWVARKIGPVKQVFNAGTASAETAELIKTNVSPPDPGKPSPKFMPWLPLLLE